MLSHTPCFSTQAKKSAMTRCATFQETKSETWKYALTMLRRVPWLLSFFAASIVNLRIFLWEATEAEDPFTTTLRTDSRCSAGCTWPGAAASASPVVSGSLFSRPGRQRTSGAPARMPSHAEQQQQQQQHHHHARALTLGFLRASASLNAFKMAALRASE